MSQLGAKSESEHQHVQARVRAAMDAQVVNEGRHQGGRAPFGYVTVDGGPHPNPRKAAEGYRLRVLAVDGPAAEVVQRSFAEYLEGLGDRAIANGLNRDGIPCPSARRPEQNTHRLADGWQGSTVRSILENPRYTGYAVFGRWTKHEVLLDPDDVAAGHVVRFRRSAPDRIVRSRRAAHPEIVDVETSPKRSCGGVRGRLAGWPGVGNWSVDRSRRSACIRCGGMCGVGTASGGWRELRAVTGLTIGARRGRSCRDHRCWKRTPKNVYLPERAVLDALNAWIGMVFAPEHRDETVDRLLESAGVTGADMGHAARAKKTAAEAGTKLRRLQDAIKAGVNPAALVDAINEAQAELEAAQVEQARQPDSQEITQADVHAMIDYLGDVGAALKTGRPR